jgi:hypothetical protein
MASEEDQLRRDIDTARDSFNRDWKELAQTHLTPEERHGIKTEMKVSTAKVGMIQNRKTFRPSAAFRHWPRSAARL